MANQHDVNIGLNTHGAIPEAASFRDVMREAGLEGDKLDRSNQRASRSSKQYGAAARGATRKWNGAATKLHRTLGRGLRALALTAAGYLGISSAAGAIESSIGAATTVEAIDRSLVAATGSAEGGAEAYGFMRSEVDRLRLSLPKAGKDFSQMAAAARGTRLEGEGVRDIFTAVSEASVVLGLSADDTSGALRAIQQSISKSKIQAEELRGQLGERLPGAFQLMARGLGVTTAELDKMLERGEVMAEDALPALARELRITFGPQVGAAVNSLQASMTAFQTALFDLRAVVGDALAPAIQRVTATVSDWLEANQEAARQIGEDLGDALSNVVQLLIWTAENVDLLKFALLALLAVKVISWARQSATAMGLLTLASMDLSKSVAAVRSGYLGLLFLDVGATFTRWAAAAKGLTAALTPWTVALTVILSLVLAINAGVMNWSDRMSSEIQEMVGDTNQLGTTLDGIRSSVDSAMETRSVDEMSAALGDLITKWREAERAQAATADELDRLRRAEAEIIEEQGRHSPLLDEIRQKLLEAERAYNAANVATGGYRRGVEKLSGSLEDLIEAQGGATARVLSYQELAKLGAEADRQGEVEKLAKSMAALAVGVEGASTAWEDYVPAAEAAIDRSKRLDKVLEAQEERLEDLKKEHKANIAAIKEWAETVERAAEQALAAADMLPDTFLGIVGDKDALELEIRAELDDESFQKELDAASFTMTLAWLDSQKGFLDQWGRTAKEAAKQIGERLESVLGIAAEKFAGSLERLGIQKLARLQRAIEIGEAGARVGGVAGQSAQAGADLAIGVAAVQAAFRKGAIDADLMASGVDSASSAFIDLTEQLGIVTSETAQAAREFAAAGRVIGQAIGGQLGGAIGQGLGTLAGLAGLEIGRTGSSVLQGASAGAAFGPWGIAVGAFVGLALDAMHETAQTFADGSTEGGRLSAQLHEGGGELANQTQGIVDAITETANSILDVIGGEFGSHETFAVQIREDSQGIRVWINNQVRAFGEDVQAAVDYAVSELFKQAEVVGVSPIVQGALQSFAGSTVEELQAVLSDALTVQDLGLEEAGLRLRERLTELDRLLVQAVTQWGSGAEEVLLGPGGIVRTVQDAYRQAFGLPGDVEEQTRANIEAVKAQVLVEQARLLALKANLEAQAAAIQADVAGAEATAARTEAELLSMQSLTEVGGLAGRSMAGLAEVVGHSGAVFGLSAQSIATSLAAVDASLAALQELDFSEGAIRAAIRRAQEAARRASGGGGGGPSGPSELEQSLSRLQGEISGTISQIQAWREALVALQEALDAGELSLELFELNVQEFSDRMAFGLTGLLGEIFELVGDAEGAAEAARIQEELRMAVLLAQLGCRTPVR